MAESVTPKSDITTIQAWPLRPLRVQNFTLVWLDPHISESQPDVQQLLTDLRCIVTTIDIFTDVDQCLDFVSKIERVMVFMIIPAALGQSTLPHIHDRPEVDSIYITCDNKAGDEAWTKQWSKIKGIYPKIDMMCEVLKQDTEQCDRNSIAISVTSNDLDHLDSSFMYTQLLKEILLEMDYDDKTKTDFARFCRDLYQKDERQLKVIDEFEHHYNKHTPIWWYTRECFTYQLLNQALRTQDVRILIKIGFFLRDVHRHVEQLHSESKDSDDDFVVYRGQGMLKDDFKKIEQCSSGLLAFNSFLSTSFDKTVSLAFARRALNKPQYVGILFKMTIDPTASSAPFAKLGRESYYKESEKEVLFSMHTVFRIGGVEMIEDGVVQVSLTLNHNAVDQELQRLTQYMRHEVRGSTGWHQLANVLLKTGNYDEAEEIYHIIMEQTIPDCPNAYISRLYHHLALVKNKKGEHQEALALYRKSLEINLKNLPPNHPHLATTYNNIGLVYEQMGDYSKALEFCQNCLHINLQSRTPNHPHLAASYSNIGSVHKKLGDYSIAIDFYQNSLKIQLESLPSNHPDLATTYSNIGSLHEEMGEYSRALECYQMSLDIELKSLPSNHPDFGTTYSNIGSLHDKVGQYSKALEFHQKSLDIRVTSLAMDHPDLASTYGNIGSAHTKIGEYLKALEFFQKCLSISLISLSHDHPDLAIAYNNIGSAHEKTGDYPKALEFYRQCLAINLKSLPPNHPHLAVTYNNIGLVHEKMGEYFKALDFHQKSLNIQLKSLPSNHPSLAATYNNIGSVHVNMRKYSKALEFFQKCLDINLQSLPSNHPSLAATYGCIGLAHCNMREYSKALQFYHKSLEICLKSLPPNHPDLAAAYSNIGLAYHETGDYRKAMWCVKRVVEIREHSLGRNYPYVESYRENRNVLRKRE